MVWNFCDIFYRMLLLLIVEFVIKYMCEVGCKWVVCWVGVYSYGLCLLRRFFGLIWSSCVVLNRICEK